jgi:plasmid stabilization system protein ParE
MSLPVILRRVARRELDEAGDWYEQRRAGLGERFVAAVERVFEEAAANPERYPEVMNGVREALVHRFPYCVYYREEADCIVILAVFHTARDPSIWQSRT